MDRYKVTHEGDNWKEFDISTRKHPTSRVKVSESDLATLRGCTIFPNGAGRAVVRFGEGDTPTVAAVLLGVRGYVHFLNGDVEDCRRGNIARCPNTAVPWGKGTLLVDVSCARMEGYWMLIDSEKWTWLREEVGIGRVRAAKNPDRRVCYAVTQVKNKTTPLHRLLLPEAELVDHINRNGLDNRMANLGPSDHYRNNANRSTPKNNLSGRKGVSKLPSGSWMARIGFRGKTYNSPSRRTFEEAVADREAMELSFIGEVHR